MLSLITYQRKTNQFCNTHARIFAVDLFRKDVWYQDKNMTLEHCFINDTGRILSIHRDIYSSCYKECPKDCKFEYYSLSIKNVLSHANSDRTKIYLEHSSMPDITINYIPDITLLSLICNFGGLLGMWLGISFLEIAEDFKILITNLIKRRKPKTTINLLQVQIISDHSNSSPSQQDNTVKSGGRLFFKRKIIKL